MKLNKSIYGILITTCVFVMIFAIIMIVLSAIKMANTLSVTKYIFTIIAFVGVFLLSALGLGIIIAWQHSTTNTTKYDNDKNK